VAPYAATRDEVRALFSPGQFVEVFVDTALSVCESRDSKGLYAAARRGEIASFTGISDPYEPPPRPEVRLCEPAASVADNAHSVLTHLVAAGFVREPAAAVDTRQG
jgi:adenylylsulfate kinase-like enzyme